ncbi:hypothetical protein DW711_09255 [Ruminococcus sp. AM27-16]|nr:hypothetical protein DW903_10935 [Ruminococcus sp. AM42-10AC]RHU02659.1 hypothetical protein DW711_09255 [Ruminococcus sp. AM27-16]
MKKKTLSGLIVFLFSSIAFSTIANADYKILTSEELESISLGDLKKEYQLLADEYSTLLNSSSDSADDSYDINQFAPGTAIKDVYVKLGEPDDMQDMDYFKMYQFISDGNNIPCYGLEDLIFTFSTDENDNIEDYTLSGSCSLDMGTQINNKIVDDLSEKYGDGSLSENKFGTSQVEWKLPSSCSYNTVAMSKDSYKKTSITFTFK